MNASTFLGRDHLPSNARLKSPDDRGWCASSKGARNSYLEIDLKRDYAFCGIRIQGAARGHVDSFQLRFAHDKRGPFIPVDTVRDNPAEKALFWKRSLDRPVSMKHGLRTTDYGLRTGYKTRTWV